MENEAQNWLIWTHICQSAVKHLKCSVLPETTDALWEAGCFHKAWPDAAGHHGMQNAGKVTEDKSQTAIFWLKRPFSQSAGSRDARLTSFGVLSRKVATTSRHGKCGERGLARGSSLHGSMLSVVRSGCGAFCCTSVQTLSQTVPLGAAQDVFQAGN